MSLFCFRNILALLLRTCKESPKYVIGGLIALEDILVHHALPPLLVDLLLEEAEEVGIVFLLAEILLCVVPVLEVLYDSAMGRQDRPLVPGIPIVALLESFGTCSGAVES